MSIVTVHISGFKCKERLNHLTNCITSLRRSTYDNFEIIVVFDQSSSEDASYIRSRFPDVKAIVHKERIGVTEGRNLGARFGLGECLIFLDEDTTAEPTWLEELVQAVKHAKPYIGIFGSFEVRFDQEARYDGVKGTCDFLGGVWDEGNIKRRIHHKYSDFETLGFALLIKRDIFEKIGGFDERFGLFGPELDLCWRARIAGYDVTNVRSAVVHHHVGITKNYYQPRKVYLLERNTLMTLIKNYSLRSLFFVFPIAIAQFLSESMLFVFVGRLDLAFAVAKAVLWNFVHARENWIWHLKTQRFRTVPDKMILNRMLKKNARAFRLQKYFKSRNLGSSKELQACTEDKRIVGRLEYYLTFRPHHFGLTQSIYINSSIPHLHHESGIALDIGCNTCELSKVLPRKIWYVGVDLSIVALKLADNKDRVRCDARFLPFRKNAFDVIFAYEILEHLVDYAKVLNEVKRAMNKEGEFLLSVPNGKSLAKVSLWGKEHVNWFTPNALDSMLATYGFGTKKIPNDIFIPIFKIKLGRRVAKFLPADWHEFLIRACHLVS